MSHLVFSWFCILTYIRAKIVQTKQIYPEREVKVSDIGDCWVFSLWAILLLNSACCIALNPLYYDKPKITNKPKRDILAMFKAKPQEL
jgi:hypothetical protein